MTPDAIGRPWTGGEARRGERRERVGGQREAQHGGHAGLGADGQHSGARGSGLSRRGRGSTMAMSSVVGGGPCRRAVVVRTQGGSVGTDPPDVVDGGVRTA